MVLDCNHAQIVREPYAARIAEELQGILMSDQAPGTRRPGP